MGFFKNWREKRKERKRQIALENELMEQRHQQKIKRWQTEDLNQYAAKIDGLILKKDEYGYLAIAENITWHEDRTTTKRVGYSGPSTTIHIAKGINYRIGSASVSSERVTELKEIFTGGLFLTNKRIILLNRDGMKILNLSKIIRVEPYLDGTTMFRDSGKRVVLTGFSNAEKFNIYLQRILNNDFSGNQIATEVKNSENDGTKHREKPKLIKFSDEDPRLQLKELFVVSKETAIERANKIYLHSLERPSNFDTEDEETEVLDRILPVYCFADLLYKQGKWIQAEYQWLSILKAMPSEAGEKLAIMYRKEKRYRNEIELIKYVEKVSKNALEDYRNVDKVLLRLERAETLAKNKQTEDNSIDLVLSDSE